MADNSRNSRRANLLDLMGELDNSGKDCRQCTGVCCTFVGNSMRVTPLEAWDLYQFLSLNHRWTVALESKLKETIQIFRLDRPVPGDGRRSFSRRRYTCPFFKDQSLGCSIEPESKPYGCLGFNALGEGVQDGENCSSRIEVLEDREKAWELEDQENQEVRDRLDLAWEKSSIPEALLDLSRTYPFISN